jgi:enolase-phosphatase E1
VETAVWLLDIEGTTTSVSFVYDVLFPYARPRLEEFLRGPEGAAFRQALLAERAREKEAGAPDSPADYARWLMDRDRKSTALKSLQGRIWESGYRSGALRSHLYPDVPRAFERWRSRGQRIAIFSSGSVQAQRLLFAHTPHGDLTGVIDGYFDTTTGPKREAESYRRIAGALGVPPAGVTFVSDVAAELDAARTAGCVTLLCVRGDDAPAGAVHPVVRTFDGL